MQRDARSNLVLEIGKRLDDPNTERLLLSSDQDNSWLIFRADDDTLDWIIAPVSPTLTVEDIVRDDLFFRDAEVFYPTYEEIASLLTPAPLLTTLATVNAAGNVYQQEWDLSQ